MKTAFSSSSSTVETTIACFAVACGAFTGFAIGRHIIQSGQWTANLLYCEREKNSRTELSRMTRVNTYSKFMYNFLEYIFTVRRKKKLTCLGYFFEFTKPFTRTNIFSAEPVHILQFNECCHRWKRLLFVLYKKTRNN